MPSKIMFSGACISTLAALSGIQRNLNKYNQVFVKEYKFGLLSLQLKKVIIVFSDIMVYLTSQIIF